MKKISKFFKVTILVLICISIGAFFRDSLVKKINDLNIAKIQEFNTKVANKKDDTLEKAEKLTITVTESVEVYKSKVYSATGFIDFDYVPINESNFAGKNIKKFHYYFDYDIGTELQDIKVYYDIESKKPVVVIPKEHVREYRIREDVSQRSISDWQQSGLNKLFDKAIQDNSLNANDKAALAYAESLVRKQRDAWYDGKFVQGNYFEAAYQQMKADISSCLLQQGVKPDQYRLL